VKRATKFRKGMQVRSIYEPGRVFSIDKSLLPGRVFHEKGATRWYTKRELRPVNGRVRPVSPAEGRNALYVRSKALEGMLVISRRRKFTCAECRTRFERKPKARQLKPGERPFCCDAHRIAYWRRKHRQAKSEASQALAATA